MNRSVERILTTHAGSLARPAALVQPLEVRTAADWQAHKKRLQPAIDEVVRMQAEAGIDIMSDGELGKGGRNTYHSLRLAGVTVRPLKPGEAAAMREQTNERIEFNEFYQSGLGGGRGQERMVCDGPLGFTGQEFLEADIEAFRSALQTGGVQGQDAFMCELSPGWLEHFLFNEYYKSQEEFVFAMAESMRVAYRAIVDAGFLLQVDDPALATKYDMMIPSPSIKDYRKIAEMRLEALNHALAGIPEDRVRYHLCWGSWHGPHTHDLPLTDLIDLMLQVRAGAYSFEAGNPRHEHEWKVWQNKHLPDGKVMLPGVVSHASNVVEHPELVADRLVRFASVAGRENVIAGTDCGMGGRVHNQIGWAKLRSLGEGAMLASGQLWS
jgi:5-methyltetrahydropteroyltriglutamate--homocysteine methyltransferase